MSCQSENFKFLECAKPARMVCLMPMIGWKMGKLKTYVEVAKLYKLDAIQTKRYIAYMKARWALEEETQCSTGYAGEWARRFQMGVEYGCSDEDGQKILEQMEE